MAGSPNTTLIGFNIYEEIGLRLSTLLSFARKDVFVSGDMSISVTGVYMLTMKTSVRGY